MAEGGVARQRKKDSGNHDNMKVATRMKTRMEESSFRGLCETRKQVREDSTHVKEKERAADGIRTHDNHVGNVMLCQLSYSRKTFDASQVIDCSLMLQGHSAALFL